ncbi:MAG: hypothetical protein ABIK83_00490 [Candidatus Zixiibacteriota bacterium]
MVTQGSTRGLFALIMSLMLLMCSSDTCLADEEATADSSLHNSLTAGSKAMQFQIDDNFQLSSFDGATISFKKYSSARSAKRLGLTIFGSLLGRDTYDDNLSGIPGRVDTDRSISTLGLDAQLLFLSYSQVRKSAYFYYGYGPMIGYSLSDNQTESVFIRENLISRVTALDRQYVLSGGGIAIIGVDWFVTDGLSLSAEYGLSLIYRYLDNIYRYDYIRRDSETGDIVAQDSSQRDDFERGVLVQSLPVKFGLSVYF